MKDIPGYEGRYSVTEGGEVWSYPKKTQKSGKFLKKRPHGTGYFSACLLNKNGVYIYPLIHRLVAIAYVSNPKNLPEVNHKNGVKSDNRVENLEWVTHQQNMSHGWRTGLIDNRGERGTSKMTEKEVFNIRKYLSVPRKRGSQRRLAEKYNVSNACINDIFLRKNWRHI